MTQADTLLTISEVEAKVGVGKMTIYRRMNQGEFPQPLRVGARSVRWRESDIAAWQDGLEKGTKRRK